jgi:hypothetical protein
MYINNYVKQIYQTGTTNVHCPNQSIFNVNFLLIAVMERVMEDLDADLAELKLETRKIRKGFALVIVNDKFEYREERVGAQQDKDNILEFCRSAKFTVNDVSKLNLENNPDPESLKTHNLTGNQMVNLFKTISEGDFKSYDAFICFISSHGCRGGILGTDDEVVPLQKLVDYLKPTNESSPLAGKPKLFFTQNCRGLRTCNGVPEPDDDDESDDVMADTKCVPTIPKEADILIAYSSVDGYESYRNTVHGSWFITELTKVLNKHAHNMNLTDMLAIVNKVVAKKKSRKGRKQMPCILSTLRNAVYFDVSKASESPSSSEEPAPAAPSL